MLLYKYRAIDDLWQSLDIVFNNRVWCSKWDSLNDPLEGRYYSSLGSDFDNHVNGKRDEWRICALSKSIDNFLLWSHYASGHKGIAIEIDIPEHHIDLAKIVYSPFGPMFTHVSDSLKGQRNLLEIKTKEWEYEEEYRIICKDEFFQIPNPIKKIYLGPRVPNERSLILRQILPPNIQLIKMKINDNQGTVVPEI
jgi:hypothetical protein